MKSFYCYLLLLCAGAISLKADPYPANLNELAVERSKTIVALDFVVERELDRQEGYAYGLVVDDAGTIVVLENMIPTWVPVDKLKNFIGYTLPMNDEKYPIEYLGQDYSSGWHLLSFKGGLPKEFVPITRFDRAVAGMGDPL
ncbi:MAG: hypothetical protein KJT03_23480, partial [Verrucomicrobiae bacterium]|nr:hypothetical protein [Verrucomicrobiae bacterium]